MAMEFFTNEWPQGIDAQELPRVADVSPILRVVSAGGLLFRQGDPTVGVFLVAQGCVRLVRIIPDGVVVTLHLARQGELFAEASLFSERYHCDAVADTESVVGLYPKVKLISQLNDDPNALWNFAGELARGLQRLRQRYELKQIRSAPDRVLQFLRLRCDENGEFRLNGTLKEVAMELGLTHESLYRTLSTLERRGQVSRAEGKLRLGRDGS